MLSFNAAVMNTADKYSATTYELTSDKQTMRTLPLLHAEGGSVMNTADKYSATTSSHVPAGVAKWNSAWLAYNQYQTEFESG